jgi:hypothetical protein
LKISIEAIMAGHIAAACFPDIIGAIGVGCELRPAIANGFSTPRLMAGS